MAVLIDERPAKGQHDVVRGPVVRLVLAAAVIECLLVGGILLPLRLDQHPPSLQTNLARTYGVDLQGMALYLVLVAALFAAYETAVRAVRAGGPRLVWIVLLTTAVYALTLLPAHPAYSSDIFHYVATARVDFVHGENPHVTPPEAVADDPLMRLSGWKWLPSPYGPAWSWLSALPVAASGGADDPTRAVLWFKALALLGVLGATAGVAVTAERLWRGAGARAAVLFGWNPVVLLHLTGDGHNDAVMLCLIAWGLVALAYGRPAVALLLLGGATLVKPAAGLAVAGTGALLLRRGAWRALLVGGVAVAALAVLVTLRYWAGAETFRAVFDEGRYFTNTPASLAVRALRPSLGLDPAIVVVGGLIRTVLLLTFAVLLLRTPRTAEGAIGALAVAYTLAVSLLGGWYQPWYAAWPLLLLAMLHRRPVAMAAIVGLTAGALLVPLATNFLAEISGRGVHDAGMDALAVVLAHGPLAVAVALAPTWRAVCGSGGRAAAGLSSG